MVNGRTNRIDEAAQRRSAPASSNAGGSPTVLVVGTLDTKGPELRYIRDLVKAAGLRARLVDVSTSGKPATSDVTAQEIALNHGRGGANVFRGERGASVSAMAEAFAAWMRRQSDIVGIIGAGGSGGASIVAPGMRALPIGVPKVLISSIASGDVGRYVGAVRHHDDVFGHRRAGAQLHLSPGAANGAHALVGMVKARQAAPAASKTDLPPSGSPCSASRPPACSGSRAALAKDWECLVFHATGVGGQSMEKLVDSGMLAGVIDITTTEVCDLLCRRRAARRPKTASAR